MRLCLIFKHKHCCTTYFYHLVVSIRANTKTLDQAFAFGWKINSKKLEIPSEMYKAAG